MNSNQYNRGDLFDKHHFITLTEFTRTANSFLKIDKLSNFLVLTIMGKFLINRCALIIRTDDKLKIYSVKGIELSDELYELRITDMIENIIHDKFINTKLFNHFKLINDDRKIIGILLYSFHPAKEKLNDDELILLDSLISISMKALENLQSFSDLRELNKTLSLKISQLHSLFELSKELSLILDPEEVYKILSYTIMGNFLINKFALIKIENNKKIILGSSFKDELQDELEKLDLNLLTETIHLKRFYDKELKSILIEKYQVALIIPLQIKYKQIGFMLCGNKLTNQDFTDDEIEFIESLGSIAAISLENIRLFRETMEMQRIEEDIRIAREIQRNLFPSKFPQSQSFEFYGFNEPSKQVGGDYFDVFRINENQILILIADVVGKGVPASLVMSNLQATVKALTRIPFELKKATTVLNNLMKQNLNTGNFITFFWGILDEKNKTFQYVNAGHNPPILIRNNEIIRLDKGGIILGVLDLNQDYNSETIQLNENDLICLFTDGFIEAVDYNEIEFGEDKFIQKLIEYKSLPVEIIANRLIEEVISFAHNSSSMDDLTILLTRVK